MCMCVCLCITIQSMSNTRAAFLCPNYVQFSQALQLTRVLGLVPTVGAPLTLLTPTVSMIFRSPLSTRRFSHKHLQEATLTNLLFLERGRGCLSRIPLMQRKVTLA